MEMERYSHVIHMVSSVSGTLAEGNDPRGDALKAAFPAGTVSGAPKVRAMQIIDELETGAAAPTPARSATSGYGGDLDICITIRTVVVKDGVAHVQAGAGIVADSVPAKEYAETGTRRPPCCAPSTSPTSSSATEVTHDAHHTPSRRRRPGLHDRQLRLVHLQPRAVPRRARRGHHGQAQRPRSPSRRSRRREPTHLVVSPGPCTPNEAGISMEVIAHSAPRGCRCSACASAIRPSARSSADVVRGPARGPRQDRPDPPRRRRRVRRPARIRSPPRAITRWSWTRTLPACLALTAGTRRAS